MSAQLKRCGLEFIGMYEYPDKIQSGAGVSYAASS